MRWKRHKDKSLRFCMNRATGAQLILRLDKDIHWEASVIVRRFDCGETSLDIPVTSDVVMAKRCALMVAAWLADMFSGTSFRINQGLESMDRQRARAPKRALGYNPPRSPKARPPQR